MIDQAHSELYRIRDLSAFKVQGYTKRKKLNQHKTVYSFQDGSMLVIYSTAQRGAAIEARGNITGMKIKINKQGV
jgi:hypothetical protein